MWIVVIVDTYYPSVYHFHNELQAMQFYNDNKRNKTCIHLARVKDTTIDEYLNQSDEPQDVDWHTLYDYD